MAKYRVIEGFYDLQDPEGRSYHLYDKGAEYPREGLEPTEERIAFLLSASNKMSKPVIEEVPEPAQEQVEPPAEEPKPKKRRAKAEE